MSAGRTTLEPMFSPAAVAAHLGVSTRHVRQLIALGAAHGEALHPTRGGLWPAYRVSHKCRRIPLVAIDRHLAHMERVAMLRPLAATLPRGKSA